MTVAAGTTPFRDEPVPQITGTHLGPKNCVPATCGCNIGRATVGRLRRTGDQVRAASVVANVDRGMSYGEAVDAVAKTTGGAVKPLARYNIANGDLRQLADAGHSGAVSIDTAETIHTSRRTANYVGNHTIGWYDYRWVTATADCRCEKAGTAAAAVDHGEFLMEDPGTTVAGYLWWSAALVYKAAQARTDQHGINVIVFPDTEGVTRVARVSGKVRKTPSISAAVLADVTADKSYAVVSTVNGGGWPRGDGATAYGWNRIKLADGRVGFVQGSVLR